MRSVLASRKIRIAAALAAFALVCVSAAAPAAASGRVTLARGVAVWHVYFRNDAGKPVRGVLMSVDLSSPNVSLNAGSPLQALGAPRRTVAAQANTTHAIGGINGDFFDPNTSASVPRGTLIHSGRLAKTPRWPSWRANFYVGSDGHATIGTLPFQATVTRAATFDRAAATSRIYHVNNLANLSGGRIAYVTSTLIEPLALPAGCTAVLGTTSQGTDTVAAVLTGLGWLPRLAANWWALTGCGSGATWLTDSLQVGDQVDVTTAFPLGTPRTAVGGGRVLVQNGAAYNDPDPAPDTSRNPQTFGCVSADGLHVVLGVLDGRSKASAGVNYGELTRYLLRLNCYSGIVFDGGGSSTLVAKLPGSNADTVLNVPSDGRPRPVADGLFVYSS